jgi:HD-GYP domain-containing protein (c-di-GMP phosphodiesterase class II)
MNDPIEVYQNLFGDTEQGRRAALFLERANLVTAQVDFRVLLQQALELMMEACQASVGVLYLPDVETGELICMAIQGVQAPNCPRLRVERGLAGKAFGEGVPVLIQDALKEAAWDAEQDGWHGLQPELALFFPLLRSGQSVGVVELHNFSLPDLAWVEFLGLRLAPDIVRAAQLDRARQSNERLEAMLAIFGQIGATLDRDQVLRLMIEYARRVIRVEACSLFLLDDETGDIVLYLASNLDQQLQRGDIRVPAGKGIIGHVIQTGEVVLVPDVQKDDRHYRTSDHTTGFITRAILAVPLRSRQVVLGGERGMIEERIIGGFEAINKIEGTFTDEDARLLVTLANHAATVLEIAGLYLDANELFFGVVKSLTEAIDAKDPYTEGHSQRVCEFSVEIARQMGMSAEGGNRIRIGSLLHDVGKIGVSDYILTKPGHLTEQEFALMKLHPSIGAKIMSQVRMLHTELPAMAQHHERLDGNGYPKGLKKDDISIAGRIVAVADVFDALTSDRPYRSALPAEEAFDYLTRGIDSAFDRSCVDALIQAYLRGMILTQKEREQFGILKNPNLPA